MRLLKSYNPSANPEFCELGSGTGALSRFLGELYLADIVAVDNNRKASKLIQDTLTNYRYGFTYINRNVLSLTYNEKKYEIVHSGGLIEHFVDEAREQIIEIHCNLVSENGYLLILVPTPNLYYKVLNEGVFKYFHLLDEIPEVPLSYEELETRLSKHEFKIIERTSVLTEIGILAKRV